jgi:hypothetical protein
MAQQSTGFTHRPHCHTGAIYEVANDQLREVIQGFLIHLWVRDSCRYFATGAATPLG